MLDFHKTPIAQKRGAQRDHAPLGHPVSDRYIGIYKELLSLRDQRVFAAVAGAELAEAGYELDVEPFALSDADTRRWLEIDARVRAATLDSEDGHVVYESYNDWLIDRREVRRRAGVWSDHPAELPFPIGTEHEELVQGLRASRRWKEAFGQAALLRGSDRTLVQRAARDSKPSGFEETVPRAGQTKVLPQRRAFVFAPK